MITDQLTNIIYFSDMLEQVCPDLYRSISTLKEKGYPIEFFRGAKDIWARDYMPIQVAPDKFVAFKYLPDYLLNPKYRDLLTENAADIARKIVGDKAEVIDTDIIVDGGNVIKCDNAVIMVDKVIQANPHYSASKLLAELTRLFGCEVFLIPWDDEEGIYGHSDGVVRYLSEGNLLFTKYPDPKYIKQCQSMLKTHFNKMHNFWMPSGGAKCRERFQWAYINYIRTKDYIFMPALSKNADCIEDTTVRRQFELRFPEYPKENIIPIYALEALKQEGGLHCCSWNILK